MTKNEFKTLKVGDKILHRGKEYTITYTEQAYDYSTQPATPSTDYIMVECGLTARISDNPNHASDDISQLSKV